MLNIGRLSAGAAEYYLGEVATSPESYYLGHGEAAGRWVGSLAEHLGLRGQVGQAEFKVLLDGCHPKTGEQLLSSRGSAGRSRRQRSAPDPHQDSLLHGDLLDVPRVAARLHLTTRRVRQLLSAGERPPRTGKRCRPFLVGEHAREAGSVRPGSWVVRRSEVERFEAARRVTKARPGYDLTLRPPKSVSILWALGTEDQRRAIRRAHRDAVDAVVDYYEAHALYARRGSRDRGRIETEGLVAAAFDHRTSRAGDPLLHTHVVVANMTLTAEGRWQAVEGRALYEHARSGGFLYQSHLRHALTAGLGLRWTEVSKGSAEVEGVPRPVIRAFSKRRDEIEDLVAESGWTSPRAHQAAALASRAPKDHLADAATLEDGWRAEAAALGFGPEETVACFGPARIVEEPDVEALFDALGGSQGLTAQASTFTRREVIEALAGGLSAAADARRVEELADRFLASGRVQPLAGAPGRDSDYLWRTGGGRDRSPDLARFSTPGLLEVEARLLAWGREGFGSPVPVASPGAVDEALRLRPELSGEQRAMVHGVCTSDHSIQAVAGRPGAGKTHAAAACVEAFAASGVPVVGCALSATAAAQLESTTRLGPLTGRPATTIARLLLDMEGDHPLPPGAVLFVDEASMVGTRDLARLAEHAARVGGAVKLIGDPDQHGPVETGGIFRVLASEAGDDLVSLVENHRQADPEDRRAIEEYRQELVESALARYDAAGKVFRSADSTASYDAMVGDWLDGWRAGLADPMIAGPNRVRRALNARARLRLKAEGHLTGSAVVVEGREFCVGDWVVTRHNARYLRNPETDGFVKNGSIGTVAAIDPQARTLTVDFASEGRITLPAAYLDGGWVEHGYARTTYGVQGATLTRALYHPGDASSFEEGYVALTRGGAETRIYIVDGALVSDEELGHRAHEPEEQGLDTVCQALEQRRSRMLAHEADPSAAAVRDRYEGWNLRDLRAERERLQSVLDQAPASVDEALRSAVRRRDALLTQRQVWTRRLERHDRRPGRRRTERHGEEPAARRELDRIERALVGVDARLGTLRARYAARNAYLRDHADDAERLVLVRRAEAARELKVRVEAAARVGCPEIFRTAGERHLARHSAERALLDAERRGQSADVANSGRPGASLYEAAVRRRAVRPATPEVVGPDEPSLF
ncbi:MAG: relaxase domain-containing protein [Actinobacteria bacterium]|nr:relaxase domain-containing protein [Actinomycetota bacterium]